MLFTGRPLRFRSPAKDLRGINLQVQPGGKELAVTFPNPEADNNYAIVTECIWATIIAVRERTPKGFKLIFETACPKEGGTLDWLLVR